VYASGTLARLPGTLTAAFYGGLSAVVLPVIGAILIFATGRDFVSNAGSAYLRQYGVGALGHDQAVDTAYGLLVTRAVTDLFFAVLLLVFVLLARKGPTWARIVVTVMLVLAVPAKLLELIGAPLSYTLTNLFVVALAIAVPVLFFLPASNRYNRARKAAGRITSHNQGVVI
jgi:hypothetical protein